MACGGRDGFRRPRPRAPTGRTDRAASRAGRQGRAATPRPGRSVAPRVARRRRSFGPPPEDQGRVLATEPERVREGDLDVVAGRPAGGEIEAFTGRIRLLEVDRGRDAARGDRPDRD